MGGQFGGGAYAGPNGGANWGGSWGPVGPNFVNNYQGTLQTLRNLQQQYRDDPNAQRDINGLIRDMTRLDPSTYSNDPVLSERINSAVLTGIEQVEMELRRKVDASDTSVRSQAGDAVPQGYSDAVAQYFRKLSEGKPGQK
jgi:hypothetical protein